MSRCDFAFESPPSSNTPPSVVLSLLAKYILDLGITMFERMGDAFSSKDRREELVNVDAAVFKGSMKPLPLIPLPDASPLYVFLMLFVVCFT